MDASEVRNIRTGRRVLNSAKYRYFLLIIQLVSVIYSSSFSEILLFVNLNFYVAMELCNTPATILSTERPFQGITINGDILAGHCLHIL